MQITNLSNTPGCKPGFLIVAENSKGQVGISLTTINHFLGSNQTLMTRMRRAVIVGCPRFKTEPNSVFVGCSNIADNTPPMTITTQLNYFDNATSSEDGVKQDFIAYINPNDVDAALDPLTSETIILK